MHSYYFKIGIVFFVSIIFIGCIKEDHKLEGSYLRHQMHSELETFDQITFSDSNTVLVDKYGLKYYYDKADGANDLVLRNKHDTLIYSLQMFKDSFLLDIGDFGRKYEGCCSEDTLNIELVNVPGRMVKPLIPSRLRRQVIKVDKSPKGEMVLMLNDRVSKLEDIPLFLECHDCGPIVDVVILMDKDFLYHELMKVYYPLMKYGLYKVLIVTQAKHLNEYEVVGDNIGRLFKEDVHKVNQDQIKYPLPPFPSKADYYNNITNPANLKDLELSRLNEFKDKFDGGYSHLNISYKKDIPLKEYVEILLEMRKYKFSKWNEISTMECGVEFVDLDHWDLRNIKDRFPTLIFDRF